MTLVNVLLDLPILDPMPIYTYQMSDSRPDFGTVGWRVLVERGKNRMEGWIVDQPGHTPEGVRPKPVLEFLGRQPLFDTAIWELAQWVSEYYLCPVNITLKAMLPPGAGHVKPLIILPVPGLAAGGDSAESAGTPVEEFLQSLLEQGQMEINQALQILTAGQLEELCSRGLIRIPGRRQTKNEDLHTVIAVGEFDETVHLPVLRKRAPRQAEAMELIIHQRTELGLLQQRFGRRVIRPLLNKGYIKRESDPQNEASPGFTLTSDQSSCLEELNRAAQLGRYQEYLLFGITGSGKTEIYLRLARQVIAQGKKVMVLVPEIALTRHLTGSFTKSISRMAVLHSSMNAGERCRIWQSMVKGEVDLVLGTRLAVFAPLHDLGLIIVDEEQENTFKQEESPRYHVREVAGFRARQEDALLVMGSATPSLETFYRSVRGQVKILRLHERVGKAVLPVVRVEDMKRQPPGRNILSPLLRGSLNEQLNKGRQSILFINRRGHSPVTLCRHCGQVLKCPNCSVPLSYHRTSDQNICHYCDYRTQRLSTCPNCGSTALQPQGTGTQKVEEEIRRLFPQARVERLDADSSRRRGRQQDILDRMRQGKVDILIGTQMVAKGLDFPQVSLVGIVDADSMINIPDFRSGERAFQLMVQAAGRAGRGSVAGQVIIQTFNPDHYVIERAARQDYEGFFREEMKWREILQYPPYTHLLRIVISGENEQSAGLLAAHIADSVEEALDASEDMPIILGPAPCPLARLHRRYRFQILIKSSNLLLLSSIGRYIIKKERTAESRLEVDIDPLVTM